MTDLPPTAARFDDVQAAEARDALWAPLAPINQAMHLVLGPALSPLPQDAHILLVGVGTGPELLALAAYNPGWRFTALDPAPAMLTVCRRRVEQANLTDRCTFHCGTVDSLGPDQAFDAATAITVSHFFEDGGARTRFFRDIAGRLKPGAPFINADLAEAPSPEAHAEVLQMWSTLMHDKMPADTAHQVLQGLSTVVTVKSGAYIDGLLREAGFTPATLIFQTLLFNAWQCRRQPAPPNP